MRTQSFAILASIPLAFTLSSSAATVYTDPTAFHAAAPNSITETFESVALSGTADIGARSSLALTHFSLISSPAAIKVMGDSFSGAHNTTLGGSRYLYLDTDLGGTGSTTTFLFASPITAFGFTLIDLDQSSATINIPDQISYVAPFGSNGNEMFLGFVSSVPFTSISINSGNDSAIAIDDVNLVPEPTTTYLIALGAAVLVRARRRT